MGCNFHFNQSVYRKIQKDNVVNDRYKNDGSFNLHLRMFTALAFVPVNDVRESFVELLSSDFVQNNRTVLSSFIYHFETTWIGRAFSPAKFKLEWWNAYDATSEGQARTNSQMEGWHGAFSMRVASRRPTFFKLGEKIKSEQGQTEYVVVNEESQGPSAEIRQVYRDRQKLLQYWATKYAEIDKIRYLRSIAHSIKF